MTDAFDYFIVFAEMRTGSNFLETNLNALDDVACLGEAFNPHFIGYPNSSEILGVTQAMRDADPMRLLDTIRETQGQLSGFRYFHDHDPRILETCLTDPRCAKIILTRNPLDSYVSWKIAQATGQWKLTDVKRRKQAQADFDVAEFQAHVTALQEFQVQLLTTLQTTGQTAFYVAFEDLQDVAVMNGLAQFLGVDARLEELDQSLKRQNPDPISAKVRNFEMVEGALAGLDQFNLSRTPNFEPRRGAMVPSYVAAPKAPLLYMPIKSGPEAQVRAWFEALDGTAIEADEKFNQKTLRQWMRRHPGHRSFTVLRHPVARAHAVFCQRILQTGEGSFAQIRQTLRKSYKIPLPANGPDKNYDRAAHHAAFVAFLGFLKANLAGQTGVRVDASWSLQSQICEGFGQFALPDFLLREDEIEAYLPAIAQQLGYDDPPTPLPAPSDEPYALADIYDQEIEDLTHQAYQRDYLMFGFGAWGEHTDQ